MGAVRRCRETGLLVLHFLFLMTLLLVALEWQGRTAGARDDKRVGRCADGCCWQRRTDGACVSEGGSASSDNPLFVILFSSSPRSGSTFVGEILTLPENTTYFFEPFYYYTKKSSQEVGLRDVDVVDVLRQLLTCQLEQSPVLREDQYRAFISKQAKPSPNVSELAARCRRSAVRVVKLVRPALAQVLPLLAEPALAGRLQLLHLVRDPRASIASLLRKAALWAGLRSSRTFPCRTLRADLAAVRHLRDARYRRVRYETLAAAPHRAAAALFDELGLPEPPQLAAYLRQHVNATEAPRTSLVASLSKGPRRTTTNETAYFSTFRASDFDPLHWRKEVPPKLRAQMNADCSDVVRELGYDP